MESVRRIRIMAGIVVVLGCQLASAADDTQLNARAVSRLIAKGSADSLAAAALLQYLHTSARSESRALLARALEVEPERKDLTWLAYQLCSDVPDCDPKPYSERLRQLDPTNGAAWIGDIRYAAGPQRAAAVDVALTNIGTAGAFRLYFNPLIASLSPEVAAARHNGSGKVSRSELRQALIETTGITTAVILPALQFTTRACKDAELQVAGRLEKCRGAARALANADTYFGEAVGLSLVQRLAPAESAEGRAATEQRRVLQYRMEKASRVSLSSSMRSPADYLQVLRAHEREQDVSLALLQQAHIALDPPASWVSSLPPHAR